MRSLLRSKTDFEIRGPSASTKRPQRILRDKR